MEKEQDEGGKVNMGGGQISSARSSDDPFLNNQDVVGNRYLLFEKNYPKNIFIPLIQHLAEMGLQKDYELCVGTRQSFEGKNVVSLAEIHKVLTQPWFHNQINIAALVSNMANKILLNSKIKKKLFHILLIKQIFQFSAYESREFKKQVSKKASQISQLQVPEDTLFTFPSAMIFLLDLFSRLLEKHEEETGHNSEGAQEKENVTKKYFLTDQNSSELKQKVKQSSSKQEYKYYISKIIAYFNCYSTSLELVSDSFDAVRETLQNAERNLREKYNLPEKVPNWSHFMSCVVNNCYLYRKSKSKLTYSLLNQWIQHFKEMCTSVKGFDLKLPSPSEEEKQAFMPIVLVDPPFL